MKNIFDFNDDNFIFKASKKLGINTDGDFMLRLSNNLAMDMESGDIHLTTNWIDEEDED